MEQKLFTPEAGVVYKNRNGSCYRCIEAAKDYAQFVNQISGWMLFAYNVRMYTDGCIEWDWSRGGRFAGENE